MDFEALAELLIPLAFFALIGGIVVLRMLKPYGDKILDLVREIQKDRHQAMSETRDLQQIRDRLDMLAERQDFLETLVEHRLGEGEQEELERLRREELGPGTGGTAAGGTTGSTGRPGARSGGSDDPQGEPGS